MNLGIFAKTFTRPTLEATLDAVRTHGLDCIQFNFACAGLPSLPDEIGSASLDEIRLAVQSRFLRITAVSGTFNLIHPDPDKRQDGLRRLGHVAAACPALGTSILTLCSGTRDPKNMWGAHPDNQRPEAWRDLQHSLQAALEMATPLRLTLAVEPEAHNVVDSAGQARRLLDEMQSPFLKIVIDPANLLRGEDLARRGDLLDEMFELLGPDIVLAHAKELAHDGSTGGLALGQGALDWNHYLSLLQEAGYQGPVIMHGFSESEAGVSTAFLRQRLKQMAHRN